MYEYRLTEPPLREFVLNLPPLIGVHYVRPLVRLRLRQVIANNRWTSPK
jgi:hypothetical protein